MTIPQILLIIAAYFIGAIPFAYIIVKLVKNIDIRTVGSGNAGATNAARVLGKWGFISVFILDALKGFLPVFISYYLYGETVITLVVAAVVVLGHTYTVFLGFKGGKGVATGAGVFLALAPIEIGIALIVFIIVFLATKMVSAGSILGSLALLISVCIMSSWFALKVLTAVIVFFVIFKHRSNIVRILKGEENRFVKKKEKDAE
ncbi:MAG TPA: glycerol-3-phosphate 1-O-acyltransferase PlsY [Candidatus Mucispirillum faecigallinarum]|uniref:Glycerol-3-phosphate acyltransferase n=1 Tax=Candidatus Mucispirillum faecigallinarum TaxID=2838699 RepID=A0A9D2GU35_9BACT|nr:glycerol-3-phosphate 1-O-acyltransferase PlsY [Candidatus Mucispirillum faecigallinarum]